MSKKISQKLVNDKCDYLKKIFEEVTFKKVKNLIGDDISSVDLIQKIQLYNNDIIQARKNARLESIDSQEKQKDIFLEEIENILILKNIKDNNLAISIRNGLQKNIDEYISKKIKKFRVEKASQKIKILNLEISNKSTNKLNKELAKKANLLKKQIINLKETVSSLNSKLPKYLQAEKDNFYIEKEDFRTTEEQLEALKENELIAVYIEVNDKGTVALKVPGTYEIVRSLRNSQFQEGYYFYGNKFYFDNELKIWIASKVNFNELTDFFQRQNFVLSLELETVLNITTNTYVK